MPGTRQELAVAARTRISILQGWQALRSLEPDLEALHRTAGTPVTARLAWWRAVVAADPGAVPLLLARRGPGGTLTAAALVALRDRDGGDQDGGDQDGGDQDGDCQLTSGRPHTDDIWEVAAVSARARRAVLAELARYARRLGGRWRLALTGLRDGEDAVWLAGQLPAGRVVPAPPVPGICFTQDEVTLAPGIGRGLDRSGQRIGRHALSETIEFERDPARLRRLRDEIEAVHRARDHDAGRVSDLDDGAGVAFWRSVYDLHAARGELEVAVLRLDGHLAAYVIALPDPPVYRVFDGRFAPAWRLYSPGRRLEVAVVERARRGGFGALDWMSSVAPEKLVASNLAEPRWAVTAAGSSGAAVRAGDEQAARAGGGCAFAMTAAAR
jgi:hypothetical protein